LTEFIQKTAMAVFLLRQMFDDNWHACRNAGAGPVSVLVAMDPASQSLPMAAAI
jgi:hypothetical protein